MSGEFTPDQKPSQYVNLYNIYKYLAR